MLKLIAYRITNFRSIIDSNWISASSDAITVFVGQNESGKTSVLQALHLALNRGDITEDDLITGRKNPIVYLDLLTDFQEADNEDLQKFNLAHVNRFKNFLTNNNNIARIKCEWHLESDNGVSTFTMRTTLANEVEYLKNRDTSLSEIVLASVVELASTTLENNAVSTPLEASDAAELIFAPLPGSVFFNAESGLLPSTVEIDDTGKPTGKGALAAKNFLTIADVDLPSLIKGTSRYRETILSKANTNISNEFLKFWTQTIGEKSKISLECDIKHYDSSVAEKVGKPYLEFWISNGTTKLYPRQRSLGVRWFISFYLQLTATQKKGRQRFFILDEPGANLHAKAQADVLRLINKLCPDLTIIYSTHSPQMIEYEKLHRVRAVQRKNNIEDSPTVVIDGYLLGSASSDTLSPILAAMGTDMSKQSVIQKYRNVLLEEISGYYYLKAFWLLTNCTEIVHFIAASGVNKLPSMVNMFLGWGLDFVVAVDDDKQGRDVYKQLKRDLFLDQDNLSSKCLLKIPGCTSIEEAFSTVDFAKYVLKKSDAQITEGNAEFLKRNQISKPVTALQFLLTVESKEISLEMLEQATQDKIKKIVTAISTLLKDQTKS